MQTEEPSTVEKTDQALRLLFAFLQIKDSSKRIRIIDLAEELVRDESGKITSVFDKTNSPTATDPYTR